MQERYIMDLDQYLIQQLNNKFINQPVLINKLISTDLVAHHPQDFFPEGLNDGGMKECYVLTPRHLLFGLSFRPVLQTRNGYWMALARSEVKICSMNGVIGVKSRFCFFEGEYGKESKTNWNMVEYRLLQHCCSIQCVHRRQRPNDWALCKVYDDLDPDELTSQLNMMDIGEQPYMET